MITAQAERVDARDPAAELLRRNRLRDRLAHGHEGGLSAAHDRGGDEAIQRLPSAPASPGRGR